MHRLFTPEGGEAEPVFRIGLRPIPFEDWFEGGEADPAARKTALLASQRDAVWGEQPGSQVGQAEVAAMIAAWRGAPLSPSPEPPLWRAALAVSDDLCLMEKREGLWTLTAASLCAPSFFTAAQAVGQPLSGLHAPVPGFNDGFLARVTRMFDAMDADRLVERRNWSLVPTPDLFLPSAEPLRAELPHKSTEAIGAALHVRRERQTLRRLPSTGGMLFTIRIWTEPLADLLADPDRKAAFAAMWDRLMGAEGEDFRTYKRLDLFDTAVVRLLG